MEFFLWFVGEMWTRLNPIAFRGEQQACLPSFLLSCLFHRFCIKQYSTVYIHTHAIRINSRKQFRGFVQIYTKVTQVRHYDDVEYWAKERESETILWENASNLMMIIYLFMFARQSVHFSSAPFFHQIEHYSAMYVNIICYFNVKLWLSALSVRWCLQFHFHKHRIWPRVIFKNA